MAMLPQCSQMMVGTPTKTSVAKALALRNDGLEFANTLCHYLTNGDHNLVII